MSTISAIYESGILIQTRKCLWLRLVGKITRVADPDPDSIGSVDPDPDPGGQKWPTKVEKNL